jgi:hypothetical protein
MRIIGLDIHRAFAEAVAWEDGKLRRLGRVDMRRDRLKAFAAMLTTDDVVVVEATGNAAAVANVIGPYVKRVVIANPKQVRIIAHAKIKTDTIDAGVLAQLYAIGFLPEVWIADETTQALRRQVTRRITSQPTERRTVSQSARRLYEPIRKSGFIPGQGQAIGLLGELLSITGAVENRATPGQRKAVARSIPLYGIDGGAFSSFI